MGMKEPLVSIIMTNYNHEDCIRESVEAVLNQTYSNFQFIIVDDGSTDDSVKILQSFTDERIELYTRKENVHISAATNYAMQFVKGEYAAIADSDDLWTPDKLKKQVEFLQKNPQYEACFTWVDIIDENGKIVNEKEKDVREIFNCSTDTREEWLRFFFFIGNRTANPTSIVTTKALKEIGEHNPAFVQGHDFDWWVRFTKKYQFAVIEEPLLRYRRYSLGGGSNTSARNDVNDIRFYNEYMLIRKHFFEDMDQETFIAAFSEQFRNPNSRTALELECEKAFLMCKEFNGSSVYSACGMERLAGLLADRETAAVLKETFHFDQKDFYKMNGVSIYMDKISQGNRQAARQKLEIAEAEIGNLKKTASDLNTLLEGKNQETESLNELLDAMKLQYADLELKLEQQRQQLEERQQQLEEKQRQLEERDITIETMLNSLSWKVTKPMRNVKRMLKTGDKNDE